MPTAELTLRKVPEGLSDDVALFAGDVMGTGYHAVDATGVGEGDVAAVLGLGPVGLCAVQAAIVGGRQRVIAVDSVDDRLAPGRVLRRERRAPDRAGSAGGRQGGHRGRGVDAVIDAVGHPDVLDMACRMARKAGTVSATGVYAEPIELHMGIVWIKALTLRTGHANVIKHVDPVLEMLGDGRSTRRRWSVTT